ncbi:peptidase [Pseudomonas floridensis]|uniref:Peptidase n=1 Tax=Pseudomonas floridensis TaxID=1958950 RepID=A0A1X0MYS7_9PSED|nr:PepSY domain-containing protein [Pseudomonas floridensis]ORC54749.1 peptidase [Pseudomonas floridensis]
MKTTTGLLAAVTLSMTAFTLHARSVDPDMILRLSSAGTLQSYEQLDAQALSRHPGATIIDTELTNQYGRYVYKVELLDAQDIEWDLEIDAVTGQVFRNHQDN